MSSALDTLSQFITRAERDRKYATNTAAGLRAALRMFGDAMNEQEKESLEVLETRLDQIYSEVFRRNSGKMSSQSLQTYYNRVKRVINDHNDYGTDPIKMATWSPQRRLHTPRPKNVGKKQKITAHAAQSRRTDLTGELALPPSKAPGTNDRFEISFDSGQRAVVILPSRRSRADVVKLSKLVEFLEATTFVSETQDEAQNSN